ncbi:hypothetical protein T230_10550 [Tannerella sp. oral taxon BU063 isolate Cell 1/3]|uniref:Uncharacterized protein n=1 Tax=Tannerella sp. oral taxon BU063 isolate Cell 1/3 TaxID=1411022 RepID=W2CI85_9BACT|nr:hypothetical protein T230_10550 [Tannerella sp. oral taxon BU063 isolate Cell 1/3]
MEQVKLDIPRVLIFTKVSSTRLNNTLHVQYHRKQYELVMAVDKTKLKLPLGLPEAWNKGIDYETMIDQEATISDDTALLKVKDAERDEQLMNIFGIIRAQRHSHKTNIREAAIRLSNTLSPYENIRSLAYEMESGRLEGMKKDLTKRTAEVATLGLNDEFDNLFKLNEEFEKLHVGRRVENTDTKLPLASVIRPQTDAALEVVCQYIQAAYNSATSADDKALLERLADHMNATSNDFKTMQRNLVVPRKKDTPKEPKTPKDPKPKKPGKDDGKPDIKLPEEEPKKPDPKQPDPKKPDPKKPGEGGGTGGTGGSGGGPEIHLPEE